MKERSDLMSLFLRHGIGSLSDMRRMYDEGGPEYSGGELAAAKKAASLTRDQWNALYKQGKVSIAQIPRRYQSWIEGAPENSGMSEVINQGRRKFLKDVWDIGETAVDFIPVVGDIKGLTYDPYMDYRNNGLKSAVGTAMLGTIGLLPIGGDAVKEAAKVSKKAQPLYMTHIVDTKWLKENRRRGEHSLIAPSFGVYPPGKRGTLGSYGGEYPAIFFGTRNTVSDPDYRQFLGDGWTPTVPKGAEASGKTNKQLSGELKQMYKWISGDEVNHSIDDIRRRDATTGRDTKFDEGKLFREFDYSESPTVIIPDDPEIIEEFRSRAIPYKTYSREVLDKTGATSDESIDMLSRLIEEAYRFYPDLLFFRGGRLKKKAKRFA